MGLPNIQKYINWLDGFSDKEKVVGSSPTFWTKSSYIFCTIVSLFFFLRVDYLILEYIKYNPGLYRKFYNSDWFDHDTKEFISTYISLNISKN